MNYNHASRGPSSCSTPAAGGVLSVSEAEAVTGKSTMDFIRIGTMPILSGIYGRNIGCICFQPTVEAKIAASG